MSKRPCNNEERVSTSNEKTLVGSGLRNSLHGNVFQLKLLMLFLIRGIGKNYHQFQLATEMPGMGGKYDDLVFRYQSTEKAQERYRYLQAKHKQDESVKIKAKDLLKDNVESEFSLAKYFRSFCRDIKGEADASRLDSVQDCIICTNIGIDKKDLENEGIELEEASPPLTHHPSITGQLDILAFETVRGGKTAVWHKLKSTDILRQKIREWSDIHSLAKKLLEIAETDKKRLELRNELFKNYHVALFKENVMVRQGAKGRLHSDFLTRQNSQNKVIQKFGQILSHVTFVHYCENLTFTEKTQKMIKVDQKQFKDFDDKSLPSALPKHSKKMEWDFEVFSQYRHDLVDCQNVLIISSRGKTSNTLKFSKEFVIGSSRLSAEAAAFRETLCNYFFVHHWKDLTFQLSENFGHSQDGTTDKSLDNFVKEEDIDQFLDKLIIVNNMPNEVELGKFLTKEIGQHYKVMDSDFQSSYILENMLDWFKEENSNWYSSVKGKRLLKGGKQKMKTFRATSLSLDYQEELNGVLSFNEIAVEKMAVKLKSFLVPFISESSNLKLKRISVELHITSSSPELTAVKVFAALKHPIMADIDSTNFQQDDSYLATSSGRLQKGSEKKWMKHALTKEGNPSLLIIVCEANGIVEVVKESEDDRRKSEEFLFSLKDEFESLINEKKRVITIGTTKKTDFISSVVDKITYGQLSDKSKLMLLSKTVTFQKNQIQGDLNKADSNETDLSTVDQLIGCDDCENVLDAPSIEELMFERKPSGTQIPSYSASVFEQTLYIKRRILFDFHFNDGFWTEVAESLNKREGQPRFSSEKLQKQCRIDSKTGSIEWPKDIDRDLQKKIWEEIIEQSKKSSKKHIYEDDLLEHILSKTYFTTEGNRQRQAVIISGVAGTGKSTLLSYFYDEIKKKNPTTWVIRINLTDYQKALKEFLIDNSGIDRLTVFNFLINLIPVENNSPFANSLLKHRLKTGDRIVLMLDGFDEIDNQCQDKTIQLIKSLVADKTRKICLFVTTRSHMSNNLQFELSQLAYCLDDFSRQDQIDCLTSFWVASLNVNEAEGVVVKNVAELLIDRVTATVKDRERSFIGIPLQCRILAECHLPKLISRIQKYQPEPCADGERTGGILTIQPIFNKLLANFNLVGLYRMLMEKKREIYRKEKAKVYKAENYYVDEHVNQAMNKLEKDLFQLAVETIIVNPKDADKLLGRHGMSFQSQTELKEEESKRDDDGIKFGLLDERKDVEADETTTRKKVVFLHRTYAEFFVADYLYKGFHLDEDKHNRLLENQPVRHFIITEIFAKSDQYNGVQIFLNSMFGMTVDMKEWRERISGCSLPHRFHQFANDLIFPQVDSLKIANALYFSVKCRQEEIFLFLCDCLNATCDRPQVKQAIKKTFLFYHNHLNEFSLLRFLSEPNKHGDASVKVFDRFLSYFDSAEEITELMKSFLEDDDSSNFHTESLRVQGKSVKLQKEIFGHLLEFFENNRRPFNQIVEKSRNFLRRMLSFFMWNENYHDGHLKTLLKLLSETDYYSSDIEFAKLLIPFSHMSFIGCELIWIDGRIEKTLSALRDVNRMVVAIILWQSVMLKEPKTCRWFYRLHNTDYKPTTLPINETLVDFCWLNRLFGHDSFDILTRLHREALFNQKKNFKEILHKVEQVLKPSKEDETSIAANTKSLAQDVPELLIKSFSPLFVAIMCGHEEICDSILSFLKRVGVDEDELKQRLTKDGGFLHHALLENVVYQRVEGVKLILEFVKKKLGQVYLLNILRVFRSQFHSCTPEEMWPTVVEIVVSVDPATVDRDIMDYYKDLNDVTFYSNSTMLLLGRAHVGTLRRMVSAIGIVDWTKRLLDKHVHEGSNFILSKKFLGILSACEVHQLLDTITRKTGEENQSYSDHFTVQQYSEFPLIEFVTIHAGETKTHLWVKWLVLLLSFIDEDNYKKMIGFKKMIDASPAVPFPQQFKNELMGNAKERAQKMIQKNFFSSPTSLESSDVSMDSSSSDSDDYSDDLELTLPLDLLQEFSTFI